jgi:hypothetical protein
LRGPGNFSKKRRTDPSAFSKNRRRNTAPDGSDDSLHMTHFISSLRRDWDRWINNNINNLLLLSSILSGFFQENWRPFCKSPRREHCKNLSSVFLTGRASPWGNIFWYSSDPVLCNIMANCIPPTMRELQRMSYSCRHTKKLQWDIKPWRIAYIFMK